MVALTSILCLRFLFFTAWKVSLFGVILVRIFRHSTIRILLLHSADYIFQNLNMALSHSHSFMEFNGLQLFLLAFSLFGVVLTFLDKSANSVFIGVISPPALKLINFWLSPALNHCQLLYHHLLPDDLMSMR